MICCNGKQPVNGAAPACIYFQQDKKAQASVSERENKHPVRAGHGMNLPDQQRPTILSFEAYEETTMKQIVHSARWIIAILIILSAGAVRVKPAPALDTTPWPTAGWETAEPEEQGIDSAKLADMFNQIQDAGYNIHSVLIVRHGRLVAQAYRAPNDANTLHQLMSCTKSFISALVGIAIDQGVIQSIDQRVLDFFPDRTPANLDDAKRGMTLRDLLTMSGGFDWQGGMLEEPSIDQLYFSPDWVQFMLDLPLSDAPGSRFVYNSGGSHLLSAIVQQATGQTAEEFARVNLFAPLGITSWQWQSDPQGISMGYAGLWLAPGDMAKLGYLYLHGGQWDGQQIVPAQWVADSTRQQIEAGGEWLSDGYGYQWWVDAKGYFMALGFGGQYIVVVPDRDMVVAFTSGLPASSFFVPEDLLNEYILPASESSAPLPDNPEGRAALQAAIDTFQQRTPSAVPALPDTARRISGQMYRLDADNGWGLTSLGLIFKDGEAVATLILDDTRFVPVGLDGVLRRSDTEGDTGFNPPAGLRGAWLESGVFVLEMYPIGTVINYTFTFDFEDHALSVNWQENVSGQQGSFKGQQMQAGP
jgi:CubicO group peptidase (beta-lactamase class C family)